MGKKLSALLVPLPLPVIDQRGFNKTMKKKVQIQLQIKIKKKVKVVTTNLKAKMYKKTDSNTLIHYWI